MKAVKITTLLLFALLIGIASNSYAQISIGGKVGLNMAKFSGDDKPDDQKSFMGLSIGIFGNYQVNDMFSLQGELNYEKKGGAVKDATETDGVETMKTSGFKFPLGYLNIPVLAKVTFGEGTKFYLNLGPTFGFLLSARMKGSVEYTNTTHPELNHSEDLDDDLKDSFKGFDFGVLVGAGAIIPVNEQISAIADIRYNKGLSKLDSDGESKMYNSVFGVNVGLIFKLAQGEK
nr:PorT family protein [Bacteroidota bacterium]